MSVEMIVTTTKTKNKLDPKIITKYKVGQIGYDLQTESQYQSNERASERL